MLCVPSFPPIVCFPHLECPPGHGSRGREANSAWRRLWGLFFHLQVPVFFGGRFFALWRKRKRRNLLDFSRNENDSNPRDPRVELGFLVCAVHVRMRRG